MSRRDRRICGWPTPWRCDRRARARGLCSSWFVLRVSGRHQLGTDPLAEREAAIDRLRGGRAARRADVVARADLAEPPLHCQQLLVDLQPRREVIRGDGMSRAAAEEGQRVLLEATVFLVAVGD